MIVQDTTDATNVISRVNMTTCWIASVELTMMMCVRRIRR